MNAEEFYKKYKKDLDISIDEFENNLPEIQDEAFKLSQEIDKKLNETYKAWFEESGESKNKLENLRDHWKKQLDLLEEKFELIPGKN